MLMSDAGSATPSGLVMETRHAGPLVAVVVTHAVAHVRRAIRPPAEGDDPVVMVAQKALLEPRIVPRLPDVPMAVPYEATEGALKVAANALAMESVTAPVEAEAVI